MSFSSTPPSLSDCTIASIDSAAFEHGRLGIAAEREQAQRGRHTYQCQDLLDHDALPSQIDTVLAVIRTVLPDSSVAILKTFVLCQKFPPSSTTSPRAIPPLPARAPLRTSLHRPRRSPCRRSRRAAR